MTRLIGSGEGENAALWNEQNRMDLYFFAGTPENQGAPSEQYLYDSGGYRVVRYPYIEEGRPVISVRGGGGQLLAEYTVNAVDAEPDLSKEFLYGAGQLLVERKVTAYSAEESVNINVNPGVGGGGGGGGGSDPDPEPGYQFEDAYHHRDHLGTLRIVTDAAGDQVSAHDFYPFGTEMPSTGELQTGSSRKRFTGHERDENTGLDYMLARYHGPSLGRFLSVDPLSASAESDSPQTWNRYNYSLNSPIRYYDPNGESSLEYDGKAKTLTLLDSNGKEIGSWDASNNADSKSKGKWEDGTYDVLDKNSPHKHPGQKDSKGVDVDSKDGAYGSDGIVRAKPFTQTDGQKREGMGVHAGRESSTDGAGRKGVEYATKGCIRTTADAMVEIVKTAKTDPLDTITIQNNLPPQTPTP